MGTPVSDPQNYHKEWKFDNGYGASVICREQMDGTDMNSYGAQQGLFEVGIYHDGGLCGRTSVLDYKPVKGWVNFGEVGIILTHIEALPRLDRCSHHRGRD